ncbi:hypothetical protein [Pseudonocardia sp. H11422]|uniref:hypothetical protein n=1 Tax=Pseudonocardia sp. H11422 TaxID=2835866 RepID=UPI001BDDBC9B|nr:hypothetical protein [Pseudonocardia sp. H11422]
MTVEDIEQARRVMAWRLDALTGIVRPRAEAGDPAAVRLLTRLCAQRWRLLRVLTEVEQFGCC